MFDTIYCTFMSWHNFNWYVIMWFEVYSLYK